MTLHSPPTPRQQFEQQLQSGFGNQWTPGDWLLTKQMLREMQALLEAAGIRFFLVYGSYLGAVRHQGVIPWDDDMDIGIFGADEGKLLALRRQLRRMSYGFTGISRPPRAGFRETFYKIWIAGRPIIPGKPWSWPFIDVFVAKPVPQNAALTRLDHRPFPSSFLSELEVRHFGGLQLSCPKGTELLKLHYGPQCLEVCQSSYWSHKQERSKQVFSSTMDVVGKEGLLVDVDQLGESYLDSRWITNAPAVTAGTAQTALQGAAELGRQAWALLEAGASVRQLLDLRAEAFEMPAIRATDHILQCLDQWRQEGRITPAVHAD